MNPPIVNLNPNPKAGDHRTLGTNDSLPCVPDSFQPTFIIKMPKVPTDEHIYS